MYSGTQETHAQERVSQGKSLILLACAALQRTQEEHLLVLV